MAAQKVVVGQSSVSAGQLKDLFRQIEDGSLDGADIQAFLEHRDPWPMVSEITIGRYKTPEAYLKALKELGSECGHIHPESIPLAQEPRLIRLAYVSVADLGLTDEGLQFQYHYEDVVKAASGRGYKLLPAEAGLALRLVCRHLKDGEWIGIGMEGVMSKDGFPDHLYIYDIGGMCESAYRFPLCALDVTPGKASDRIDYDRMFAFEAA